MNQLAIAPLSWLTGYRRLTIRYERHAEHFAGFLHLAAAATCFKKLHIRHALSLNPWSRRGSGGVRPARKRLPS
ncbi:hypothetical protein EEB14_60070 [Rhodococcus sp. WS4]|nr:hypothetical protein EEB14_60070 [Rhodococcus sp. WS4]